MESELESWRWKKEMRRVAERRARRAWGECPKGGWLGILAEWTAMVATLALFGGLTWLYVMATPDQVSAEADIGRAQLGHQHSRAANPAQLGHHHSRAANPAQLGHQHSRAANPAQLGHHHSRGRKSGDWASALARGRCGE